LDKDIESKIMRSKTMRNKTVTTAFSIVLFTLFAMLFASTSWAQTSGGSTLDSIGPTYKLLTAVISSRMAAVLFLGGTLQTPFAVFSY
jgi:hypothetical protein